MLRLREMEIEMRRLENLYTMYEIERRKKEAWYYGLEESQTLGEEKAIDQV